MAESFKESLMALLQKADDAYVRDGAPALGFIGGQVAKAIAVLCSHPSPERDDLIETLLAKKKDAPGTHYGDGYVDAIDDAIALVRQREAIQAKIDPDMPAQELRLHMGELQNPRLIRNKRKDLARM